ncbi:MAG: hypothetical protein ABFS34_16080, partial [Gemmatimonadota bacterium]
MLLDDAGESLRVVAATGHELPPEQLDPVPVGEGIAGRALAGGEPWLVADVESDPRFAGRGVGD